MACLLYTSIEGEVENSVLFRGVKIGKGAKVKNCVLMQDTVVEEGANLEYIVTDKDVTIKMCIRDSRMFWKLPADAQNSLSVRPRMPSLFTALI